MQYLGILTALLGLALSSTDAAPVPRESIREVGLMELASFNDGSDESIAGWIIWLSAYQFDEAHPDDDYSWFSCILALEAVAMGNHGFGCLLTDPLGTVVSYGHNELLHPHFRSDKHGEMVVMDLFEENYMNVEDKSGYVLWSSVESCPMCVTRLINSGVGTVLNVAADSTGGMVHMISNLPPVWSHLASLMNWGRADCSPDLVDAAESILLLNLEGLYSSQLDR